MRECHSGIGETRRQAPATSVAEWHSEIVHG